MICYNLSQYFENAMVLIGVRRIWNLWSGNSSACCQMMMIRWLQCRLQFTTFQEPARLELLVLALLVQSPTSEMQVPSFLLCLHHHLRETSLDNIFVLPIFRSFTNNLHLLHITSHVRHSSSIILESLTLVVLLAYHCRCYIRHWRRLRHLLSMLRHFFHAL